MTLLLFQHICYYAFLPWVSQDHCLSTQPLEGQEQDLKACASSNPGRSAEPRFLLRWGELCSMVMCFTMERFWHCSGPLCWCVLLNLKHPLLGVRTYILARLTEDLLLLAYVIWLTKCHQYSEMMPGALGNFQIVDISFDWFTIIHWT